MKIGEIEIPDSEVEKLPPREKRILYCLYEAHPFAVTTWTLYKCGGTGFPARKKSLVEWLGKYGLTIEKENRSSKRASFWVYWIQESGGLFKRSPKQFVGEIA